MGLSLQEQLLNAGVVDKKQVKQAEHEKRMQKKKKKKYGIPAEDSAKIRLKQQQAEQAKHHQQLQATTTYACDVSTTMIDWIKKNISPKHPYIIPVKSEEASVPLDDEVAGLVIMINLHYGLEDQDLVIQESYRLLNPGREIFVID